MTFQSGEEEWVFMSKVASGDEAAIAEATSRRKTWRLRTDTQADFMSRASADYL